MAKALIDGNEVDGAYDFFTETFSYKWILV